MNSKGFTLTEMMVTVAVAAILSMFSFDSVQQVIRASMSSRKKADFNGIVEDLRGIANRLDQCTCNFRGFSFNPTAETVNVPGGNIIRFNDPDAPGNQCAMGGAQILAQIGQQRFNTMIDRLELMRFQYIPALGIVRSDLFVQGTTIGENPVAVQRRIPLMFSTTAAGGNRQIVGCIGMTK